MHLKSTESNNLELVNYGRGYAWLRREPPEAWSTRYVLTDLGRRALAYERLFGPSPTVAEVEAQARARTAA
jgi:hypothetical protein